MVVLLKLGQAEGGAGRGARREGKRADALISSW